MKTVEVSNLKGRRTVVRVLIGIMLTVEAFGQTGIIPNRRTITAAEARELVYTMLDATDWAKAPGLTVLAESSRPDFYFIVAGYDVPGGCISRFFMVEHTTGEVWDCWKCGRYSSPPLRKAQSLLRKHIGLTNADYRELRRTAPSCRTGDAPQTLG